MFKRVLFFVLIGLLLVLCIDLLVPNFRDINCPVYGRDFPCCACQSLTGPPTLRPFCLDRGTSLLLGTPEGTRWVPCPPDIRLLEMDTVQVTRSTGVITGCVRYYYVKNLQE